MVRKRAPGELERPEISPDDEDQLNALLERDVDVGDTSLDAEAREERVESIESDVDARLPGGVPGPPEPTGEERETGDASAESGSQSSETGTE